jgi:hypothetical protein
MHGLAGGHSLQHPGARVSGQPGRFCEKSGSQLLPGNCRQACHVASQPGVGRASQPCQLPGAMHIRVRFLPGSAQDQQSPVSLRGVQRPAGPRQRNSLGRRVSAARQ